MLKYITKFVSLLASMILLSIFLANVANVLNTNNVELRDDLRAKNIKIGDSYDNLVWFLQISDIHISIFRDPLRITEFKEFCHYTITAIQPSLVLATGDLTDAKTKDSIGSEQYEDEWKHYRDILNETHIKQKTVWLDIRGNHDNFNVADYSSKHNYFANYSVQGSKHPRSYMHQIKHKNNIYSFIGVDACLEPGPRRPFNFIGMLDEFEVNELKSLIKKAEDSGTNYTVFFGHFPTSCILSTGSKNVRELIGDHQQGLTYLCGHLHQLGGLVPEMYTLQKPGFLELELGDWKDNRVYRLMAIDQGMFSFTDVRHRDWPVILVTNPKHALFYNPIKENLGNIRNSTHIRILAFSLAKIEFVKIKVDDGSWVACKRIKGPLYVVNWNTDEFLQGIHKIEVYVKDIEGRKKLIIHPFSLDGSRLHFGSLAKIALMSNVDVIFKSMFFVMLLLSILPLCLFRYAHNLVIKGKIVKPRPRNSYCFSIFKKLWILSTIDKIFWPMVIYPLYLTVGPWSIGYLVEDHIGAIFAWGIVVNGAFLPGAFTYAYGFSQLFTFQLPMTFILAQIVNFRFEQLTSKKNKYVSRLTRICQHLPFSILFIMQTVMAYLFWLAYGTLAFFLGPLRTWSLILACILYYQACNLTDKDIKKASDVWYIKSSTSTEAVELNLSPVEKNN